MSDPVTLTSATARFDLPLLFSAQAQKEMFLNEALLRIDALLHPAILSERPDPPADPEQGAMWLVATDPTGEWAGHAGSLAAWTADQWVFIPPRVGVALRDMSLGQIAIFDGGGWTRASAPVAPSGGTNVDSECRAALTELVSALQSFGIFSS